MLAADGVPRHASQLADLRDQVEALNPDRVADAGGYSRDAFGGFQSGTLPTYDDLRQQMKQQKWQFVQAHGQLAFIQALESFNASGGGMASLAESRQTEKDINRSIKNKIQAQEQQHNRLLELLSTQCAENRKLHEQCKRDLEALENAAEGDDAGDAVAPMDICADAGRTGAQGVHGQAVREAGLGLQDAAMRMLKVNGEQASQKHELEMELARLQEQAKLHRRRAKHYEKEAKKEAEAVQSYMKLLDAEDKLGLPHYKFIHEQGVVVVEPPSMTAFQGNRRIGEFLHKLDRKICTVALQYDADGSLKSAKAHEILGLDGEAELAVKEDDLGRLLTAVWAKMLLAAESQVQNAPQQAHGGA